MIHEQPPKAPEAPGQNPAAEDFGQSKARTPVRAGRAIVLLSVTAVAVAASGIFDRRHEEKRLARWTNEQAIPTVAVVSPRRGGEATEIVLPGDVEAFYNASIHGQASGYVREWRTDIGAKVRKGEILAVIETPDLDDRIAAAESELVKAKANETLAHVTAQRWGSLRNTAAVSQQAVDEKQSDWNAKSAEVEAAQANVERLKALKGFDDIVAPFDGVVTARNVDIGSFVKADSNDNAALFAVADIHKMRIYVRAPESYSAQLKNGMKATASLPEYPNRTFDATIETTSRAIDKKSRSLLVELVADNEDGALTPGAFARVHFKVPPDRNAVTLPASALLFREDVVEVATLGLDSHVSLKKVRIARDFGSEVEITGGLGVDQRVVVNPPDSLAGGEEVRVASASGGQPTVPPGQPGATLEGAPAKRADSVAQTERGRGE